MNGLVLAGGSSSRMGSDKSRLVYRDKEQYRRVYELLEEFCERVYISCKEGSEYPYPVIYDKPEYSNSGPVAALLSAYDMQDSDWLIAAVDYPLLLKADIKKLIQYAGEIEYASVFLNNQGFYEPLIGLYKSAFRKVLIPEFEKGNTSLQDILRKLNIKGLKPDNYDTLRSADTPEDYHQFKNELK